MHFSFKTSRSRAFLSYTKEMRQLLLALTLVVAPYLAAECIAVQWQEQGFFLNAHDVFFAHADTESTFRVEKVVQGKAAPNEILGVLTGECRWLTPGKRYLVARACGDGSDRSCLWWVDAEDAPRFLDYLSTTHLGTRSSIMTRFLEWQRGTKSAATFQRWLGTLLIAPKNKEDDQLARDLLGRLNDLFAELVTIESVHVERAEEIRRVELKAVARLMKAFPRETADEFDARADVAGGDAPKYRDEYEGELLDAIIAATNAAKDATPDSARN